MDMDAEPTFRDYASLKRLKFDDERISTITSREQQKTENSIEKCFNRFQQMQYLDAKVAKIHREEHQRYLESMLRRLPTNYECLDSSRPWNVYWILQAAHLLNFTFDEETLEHVVQFLTKCRHPNGGFAGGPGQYPHLAPTYAAVNSLCIIGTPSAYRAIDRDSLMQFLFSVREPDGSFRLHVDGETDVRGAYCAISCAKLTNMPAEVLEKLFDKTGDWIASCQTYEGGFGGAPDLEAHGGYTFCGIAALAMLDEGHKCDTHQLLKWNLQRQMPFEGGFQGRTNKLVDGCYSFWVGATIPITQAIISQEGELLKPSLFDTSALQEYILLCCQKANGGLIDKPGKPQDLYHTCYTLSGVSIAQHSESSLNPKVLGDPVNELSPTHPLFNVPPRAVASSLAHFEQLNQKCKDDTNACRSQHDSPPSGDEDSNEREIASSVNPMQTEEGVNGTEEEEEGPVSSLSSSISN
ncbi:PREDICTED: protein farnesyltransferase subunit beta [Rhagoletis zephyria]|uniref:protein farnesyltransferase subunit beta n=1 Tax=Rhagoletis zephyria TaxID=28612 RepID=UPI00081183A8|nr:PREDICTED: protein farnesyltransferase subunit beta [Rhagoletis zephyria]